MASAALDAVLAAIQTLGSKISAGSGDAKRVTASAGAGTFGLLGFNPVVNLPEAADPKDYYRVSGVMTVDTLTAEFYHGLYSTNTGWPQIKPAAGTKLRQVFEIHGVGGVTANGLQVQLPPFQVALTAIEGAVTSVSTGDSSYSTKILRVQPSYPTYVSSTLTLLTRYHYG